MTEGAPVLRLPLRDEAATHALGRRIAARLRGGDVVALSGGLGMGKTTMARAIIAALGHTGEVPSPSFAIIQTYDPPSVSLPICHADFYRLDDPAEVEELGLDDYRDGAALIAEWPEHAGGFEFDTACLSIRLEPADEGRIAIVKGAKDWQGRMP
ncbi:tRNA (adenosine(37)-N6)-threonylcarbamoyltransferase complex ATPase subunit type 1 TsaE [Croceicoccus hydrothermalis]|uniref:tRNA (adenosine(37)-N6)-threonylcarbamoyltransferase complex ATPase subunit type 1 TsaE n=1 Tax=Croceicoccus hydrothermalis TaxID=2867964 RepID=UPI001EFB8066|nr:tRNA (adenosine(37)-N6)-threonylcarbamoyltransferase complex ATPase subunit type 1 TsaE [Croceicoccus hydrothermalis]